MRRVLKTVRFCLLLVCVWGIGGYCGMIYGDMVRYSQENTRDATRTALDVYEEHRTIINMAADILWSHPEVFERTLGEGQYVYAQCLTRDLLDEDFDYEGISDTDWQLVRDAMTAGDISGVGYYFPRHCATAIYLFFYDTNDSYNALVYIRPDEAMSVEKQKLDVDVRISELTDIVFTIEETDYQYWYQEVNCVNSFLGDVY